jgi:glycosyltransferase involved in cell wall biosynthesis
LQLGEAGDVEPLSVQPSQNGAGGLPRLRIGILAPPWFTVPPRGYGGIERVVSYLTEGLCRAGHEVTLFAAGGSRTRAELVSVFDEPPSALLGDPAVEMTHTIQAYQAAGRFDIVHDHTFLGLASGAISSAAVVHTVHGSIPPTMAGLYRAVSPPINLITISNHQKSTLPAGVAARTIYNAVDLSQISFGPEGTGYLLFVGRMTPDKGVLEAIEIARRSGERLVLLAKVNEPPEQRYFEEYVKPALAGLDAELLFQPADEVKWRLYREAKATLFPIQWPEPFGLVMIESMASGTPVIAFRNGSVPEIIRHGETGFVCNSIEEAVEAVQRIGEISRLACRKHVAARFSAEAAVRQHEEVYRDILEHGTIVAGRAPQSSAFVGAGGTGGDSG